jgi:hypothetical protein
MQWPAILLADETGLKHSRNLIALNFVEFLVDQKGRKREMTMIQIGSKEEIELLLALFGTHTQPVKAPKKRSRK